jgi:hypothetical protein
VKKFLILSLILSIFNVGKGGGRGSGSYNNNTPNYGIFYDLIIKISQYRDKLTTFNNSEVTEGFNNLIAQMKDFAEFHQKLLSKISTKDGKTPFKNFDELFYPKLTEATQKIYAYSKNPDFSAEPETEIRKSIGEIKGIFHSVIKDMLSFNSARTEFNTAKDISPTHLYALIQFCLTKDELIPLLPEDIFQEENITSTLKIVEFFLTDTDSSLFNISFEKFLELLGLYDDKVDSTGVTSNKYNQKILHAFFKITKS